MGRKPAGIRPGWLGVADHRPVTFVSVKALLTGGEFVSVKAIADGTFPASLHHGRNAETFVSVNLADGEFVSVKALADGDTSRR